MYAVFVLFGGRLMVGHQVLALVIGVRVPASEHYIQGFPVFILSLAIDKYIICIITVIGTFKKAL